MKENNTSWFILFIGIIVIIIRITFDSIEQLVCLVSAINTIAMCYVVYLLRAKISEKFNKELAITKYGENIKVNKFRFMKRITRMCVIIVMLGGALYVIKFNSNVGNDILSISALCLSIETENFSSSVVQFILKKK